MANKNDGQLEEELLRLRVLIEQQNGGGETAARSSRRNVMKLAGAALVGVAGTAALRAVPAAAAAGGNVILGNNNTSNAETIISADSAGTAPRTSLVSVDSTSATDGGSAPALTAFSGSATSAIFAAGSAPDLQAGGFIGFKGTSLGTGRIGQIMRSDIGGSSGAPSWTPAAGVAEITQGTDASVWVTRSSGTGKGAWKRVNTMRFDATSGTGAVFVPVRVVDSRASQGSIGGQTGPFAAGTTRTWTIAGANGIPSSAVAVVGNVTGIAPPGTSFPSGGFFTLFPAGVAQPGVASLNYLTGMQYLSNFFICGLGTGANAGKLSVFIGGNSADIGIDIFAYVE